MTERLKSFFKRATGRKHAYLQRIVNYAKKHPEEVVLGNWKGICSSFYPDNVEVCDSFKEVMKKKNRLEDDEVEVKIFLSLSNDLASFCNEKG